MSRSLIGSVILSRSRIQTGTAHRHREFQDQAEREGIRGSFQFHMSAGNHSSAGTLTGAGIRFVAIVRLVGISGLRIAPERTGRICHTLTVAAAGLCPMGFDAGFRIDCAATSDSAGEGALQNRNDECDADKSVHKTVRPEVLVPR